MVLDFSVMLYRLHPLCVDHTLPTRFSLRELSHSNAIRHYFVKYLLTYLTVLDLSCGIRGLRCVMWDLTSKTEPLFGVGVFLCPRVIWFIPFSLYWALEDAARQRLWKCSSWEVQCLKDDTWNTVLKSRWTVCVCVTVPSLSDDGCTIVSIPHATHNRTLVVLLWRGEVCVLVLQIWVCSWLPL